MGTEDDNLTVFHSGMAVSLFFLMLSIKLSAQEQGRESSICVITDVVKGSIADRLGLKTGDIILSINEKEIHSDASFIKGIKSAKGSVIKIKILRKGKEIVFKTPFYADKLGIYFTFCERDRLLSPEEMKEDLFHQIQNTLQRMEIYKERFQKEGKNFRPYFYLSSLRKNLSLLHIFLEEYKNIEMEEYRIFSAYLSWAEKNWDKLSKKEKEEVKEDLENLFVILGNP